MLLVLKSKSFESENMGSSPWCMMLQFCSPPHWPWNRFKCILRALTWNYVWVLKLSRTCRPGNKAGLKPRRVFLLRLQENLFAEMSLQADNIAVPPMQARSANHMLKVDLEMKANLHIRVTSLLSGHWFDWSCNHSANISIDKGS